MCRLALIGLALAFTLVASASMAQTPGAAQPGQELTSAPPLPAPSDREASGEAVVDLADFICGVLGDSGLVPDYAQARTADGGLRRLSAAEVFALLARTAYLWDTTGSLPASVPIAPEGVASPQLEAEDVPQGEFDPQSGRQIPTDQFLTQCGQALRWVDRLKAIPTAVWVNGERLSAAEYLAGLAVCIQYAYWQGNLEDSVFLPKYIPPQTWLRGVTRAAATEAQAQTGETQQGVESATGAAGAGEAATQEVAPLGLQGEEAAPSESPMLTLLPADRARVSGKVDVLAVYTGPPAGFVIFGIDGVTRAIQNYEPYSYQWDATGASPGPHTLRVRVFDEEGNVLIDQVGLVTVVAPQPQKAPTAAAAAPAAKSAAKPTQKGAPAPAKSSRKASKKA
jgi:hypothetical protein